MMKVDKAIMTAIIIMSVGVSCSSFARDMAAGGCCCLVLEQLRFASQSTIVARALVLSLVWEFFYELATCGYATQPMTH